MPVRCRIVTTAMMLFVYSMDYVVCEHHVRTSVSEELSLPCHYIDCKYNPVPKTSPL